MKPCTVFFAAALATIVFAMPRLAAAQNNYRGSSDNPNGPTVSPYLNLLQNNNQLNGMPTYQSLVRPLVDQRSAIQRQGNSLSQLQQQVNTQSFAGNAGSRGATGHTSHFMNHSHFFRRGGPGAR
jgi:hypothetical protein